MNDPHVVSLTYHLRESSHVAYASPPPLQLDFDGFSGSLDKGVLTLVPKGHFAYIEDAKLTAERLLTAWKLDARLRLGYEALAFDYQTADVIDRDPPPPGAPRSFSVGLADEVGFAASVSAFVTRPEYPPPPKHFRVTPEVEDIWRRIERYRSGQELLLPMAYFCLTLIQRFAPDRKGAAAVINVDPVILEKLGDLTTNRGDATTARKVVRDGTLTPLSDQEQRWIESALEALVRNIAEAGTPASQRLTLHDLPSV